MRLASVVCVFHCATHAHPLSVAQSFCSGDCERARERERERGRARQRHKEIKRGREGLSSAQQQSHCDKAANLTISRKRGGGQTKSCGAPSAFLSGRRFTASTARTRHRGKAAARGGIGERRHETRPEEERLEKKKLNPPPTGRNLCSSFPLFCPLMSCKGGASAKGERRGDRERTVADTHRGRGGKGAANEEERERKKQAGCPFSTKQRALEGSDLAFFGCKARGFTARRPRGKGHTGERQTARVETERHR